MDPITQQTALATAGAAGSGPVYVDDVFSIDVWDGDGATTRTITNGIDLAGEGGMVWGKTRTAVVNPVIADTENGVSKNLFPNDVDALVDRGTGNGTVDQFNSDGFTIGDANNFINYSGHTACSWTFRKCPGFFDVVTWTGNGTAGRTVSHSLGSVPGAIWVKCTSHANSWGCYHRSTGNTLALFLNDTHSGTTNGAPWNNTDPTSTEFTVGSDGQYNADGRTYVAYIFAHDDQSFGEDGDEAIIKCGSYTGNGTSGSSVNSIDLGFEPQWVIIKNISSSGNWLMFDTMRGFTVVGSVDEYIYANSNAAGAQHQYGGPTATGFQVEGTDGDANGNGSNYIYIAIRRPHKPPEVGTDVFAIDTRTGSNPSFVSNFPVDMGWKRTIDTSFSMNLATRLTGTNYLLTNSTGGQTSDPGFVWDYMDGWAEDGGANSSVYSWMFKRAPGFFDVVNYVATGGNTTNNVPHNLGVPPEMIIVKKRGAISAWPVYHTATGLSTSTRLHVDTIDSNASNYWSSAPSATHFYPYGSDTNANSGDEWIALLFATLPGISKVGSYTGTGSDLNIDCGFTNGARFVLIKRTTGTTDWWVFDTARGINAGNDPGLVLNAATAETTGNDLVDPYSAGFTAVGGTAAINISGETYLFLAIA